MVVLVQRGWQALSGLLTLILVARFLSLEEQGIYYTITTLLGIFLSLDIGLTNALIPFVAANSGMSSDNQKHIFEIGRYAVRWFFSTGLLILALSPVGLVFLEYRNAATIDNITSVWVLVIIFSSASYMISPIVLLLEGMGKLQEVYIHRLFQGIIASTLMWVALLGGYGLLSIVVPLIICFIYTLIWLYNSHFEIISQLRNANIEPTWQDKIWPIQWRTGANIFSGYLLVFIYTPISYWKFGPADAGKVGLTMVCMNTIYVLSISGVVSRFPELTKLVSENKKNIVKNLYKTELKKAVAIYSLLCVSMILVLESVLAESIVSRFMSIGQIVCIAIGMLFYLLASVRGYYMRAHLVDQTLSLYLLAVFLMVISTFLGIFLYGIWGISISILIIFSCFLFPWMLKLTRDL